MEVLSLDPVQVFLHYALAELGFGSHLTQLQASGTLSPGQARRWLEYLQHADKHGTLLVSFTTFIIVGGKSWPDVHAKSRLTPETTADTPVRNQGPGGSLPGPGAGHPLQGTRRQSGQPGRFRLFRALGPLSPETAVASKG